MENCVVYLCEDTPDGIFTAIYDAWSARIPDERLGIRVDKNDTLQFFTDYVRVQADAEKAVKVARSVSTKIGWEAYDMIYKAALSYEDDKVDVIYHFLKMGFHYGADVVNMHGSDVVCRIFELSRNVSNEAHLFREFIRFQESKEGVLIARIKPKNQILPMVAEHFSDRFPGENFVILDEIHNMGLFHESNRQWYLSWLTGEELEGIWECGRHEKYEELWKTFFKTIAIEQRQNATCQRNHCSLRYRDYMVEFH